jgi:hypothetical protein
VKNEYSEISVNLMTLKLHTLQFNKHIDPQTQNVIFLNQSPKVIRMEGLNTGTVFCHIHTALHLDTINFFYLPTDAYLNCASAGN